MTQALLNGRPREMDSRTLAPPRRSYSVGSKPPLPRPPLAPWPNDPSMTELMAFAVAAVRAGILPPETDNVIDIEVMKLHQEFCEWYGKQEKAA